MKKIFVPFCVINLALVSLAQAGDCGNCGFGGPGGGGSPSPSPSCSPPPPSGQGGANKFNAYTGNVHREVPDLQIFNGVGEEKLAFKRVTTSRYKPAIPTPLGTGGSWRHSYYWNIVPNGTDPVTGTEIIHVDYPDGTEFDFHKETTTSLYLTGVSATQERIEQSSSDSNQYYLWFPDGKRISFRKQVNGGTTTFSTNGFYDKHNNFYAFTVDSKNRVTRVTELGGRYIQINYGSIGNFNVVNANFSYTNATATTVSVAGEFNGWSANANPMVNNNGTWTANVPVQPNTSYQYKFVVNGNTWVSDPNNPTTFPAGGPSTGNNSVMSPVTNQDIGTSNSPVPITFSYTNGTATSVSVAGQFNNWSATANPLTKSGSTWTTTMNISQGAYQYKLVVNGSTWIIDPNNSFTKPDGYGGYNSNLVVGPLDEGILQVLGSDGRSVNYNYTMFTVGGSIYSTLTQANYSDGTAAQYSYSTPTIGSRPTLATANDPRYKGAISRVAYTYQANGIEGFISQEKSLVDGTVIASLAPSNDNIRIVTTGGTTVQLNFSGGHVASRTDSLGRVQSYGYFNDSWGMQSGYTDANGTSSYQRTAQFGNPSRVTFPDGKFRATTFTSDIKPFFEATATDENGKVTSYTRDTNGRPTRIDYPDQSYETFTYDNNNFGLLLNHRLPNSATESFTYYTATDMDGKVGDIKTKTDGAGNPTTYTYDGAGRVLTEKDGRNNVTSYQYNERGQVISTTNPDGSIRTFAYDTFGNRTLVTNELGKSWTYTYDQYNRVTSVTDPLNRTTQYAYGLPNGGCTSSCSAEDKPISITLPSGKKTTIVYDTEWQKTSETAGANTADAATTSYGYDSLGNLTSTTDPRGKVWSYTYDNRDRKTRATDPNGNYTEWTYDNASNLLTEKRSGDLNPTNYIYDGANRRTDITDQAGNNTHMTYDGAGNILTLRDARQNTYTFIYDGMNRKTGLAYPTGGGSESWTYDATGNVATYTTRAGQTQTFTYDNRNRETAASWSDSTPATNKIYDVAGRLLTLSTSVSTLSYTYDNANQLLSETEQIMSDGGPKSVTYAYDADGNRSTLTYPSGSSASYAYTNRNQVATITSSSISASFTYDLAANRLSRSYGNTTSTAYSYDNGNRLLSIDHQRSAASFAKYDSAYNSVNNRTSRAETISGVTKTDTYGYDAIDEVTQVKYNFNAGNNTQDRLVGYNYDATGNRSGASGVTDSVSGNSGYTANNLNQYTAAGTLTPAYDQNGNMTSQDGWSYTYDAQSRLTTAFTSGTTITFAYDGRNRCASRTINGVVTFFYYDRWNLVEEQNASSALIVRYIHGPSADDLVARVTASGGSSYYHQDALGSTAALTDGAGNVTERYAYDVFGAPTFKDASGNTVSSSASGNRFLFTGREYVQQAVLYDYRNRMYWPSAGRFLQTDSLRFDAGDVNLCRYVSNNPVNAWDPFGLKECTDDAGIKCCCDNIQDVNLENYTNGTSIPHTFLQTPFGSWGFYPRWNQAPLSPGQVKNDGNHPKNPGGKTYKACPGSVDKLKNSISQNQGGWSQPYDVRNSPFGGRNCSGWACDRLQDAGFKPPLPGWIPGLNPWWLQ